MDRWAEGIAAFEELEAAILAAVDGWEPEREKEIVIRENAANGLLLIARHHNNPLEAARGACLYTESAATIGGKSHAAEGKAQVSIFRDIVGNPFRTIQHDPLCLTSAIKVDPIV